MPAERIAEALARVEAALRRHPGLGLHDDTPAVTRWIGGTKLITSPPGRGPELTTDMPAQLGGEGEGVTPGWPLRAGLAGCVATVIVLNAAAQGIELGSLEVTAGARSDLRGLFGMADALGNTVSAAPFEIRLDVRITAPGVSPDRLRELVEQANLRSPVASALREAVPIDLRIQLHG